MKMKCFLLICATVAGLTSCSPRSHAPPQPIFHGRTLAEWMVNYQFARTDAERLASSTAVAAIGTNAIPTLLDWVHDGVIAGLAPRYSSGVRSALAFSGFRILGPNARFAVPALVAMTKDQNPNVRHNAVWCLMEAVPADRATVTSVLTSLRYDHDGAVRRQAKLYLEQLNPCVPGGSLHLPRPANARQQLCQFDYLAGAVRIEP